MPDWVANAASTSTIGSMNANAADHAFVDRMLRVAVDVPHIAIAQMHANAAAACTHVAGGRFDFVDRARHRIGDRVMQRCF